MRATRLGRPSRFAALSLIAPLPVSSDTPPGAPTWLRFAVGGGVEALTRTEV
jgi:hypothetical protein